MIWTIARKEIHENLIGLRFGLLLTLALVFIPASFYTNYRTYLTRVADQQQVGQRNRDFLRNLSAAQLFTNSSLSLDVYWPPAAASVYALGFEETHPRHLVVGRHGVAFGAPLDVHGSVGLFGSIDYLFIVQFIFSLFAILLSFDAVTREKENGTLRTMLANRLSRAALATGKLVGGYVTLAIPLLLSYLVGLIVLAMAGLGVFSADFMARTAWILTASLGYVAVFFMLGLLVSSLVSSSYTALVASLAFWLMAVLVVPRAASLVAQIGKPVKSGQVVWLEKLAAAANIDRERSVALGRLWAQIESAKVGNADQQQSDWSKARGGVVAPFEERKATVLAQIDDDYRRRRSEQRQLGLAVARLSPAGSVVSFITEMAQTGLDGETRFSAEAERYRGVVKRDLFDRVYADSLPGGRMTMGMIAPVNARTLPEFRLRPASVIDSLRGWDLAILLLWFLGAGAMVYRGLARYDVR
jgi:hypothetical protein